MSYSSQPFHALQYPVTRRSDHIDVYKSAATEKGIVTVPDPYHWLEEDTPETERWIDSQASLSRSILDKYPDKHGLEEAFLKNLDYEKFSAPRLVGDSRWYWAYNSGLQAQSVYYRSMDSTLPRVSNPTTSESEIFFDPNMLTDDGTAAIVTSAFSRCGKYWAYAVSISGSDVCTIYVRKTSSPFREENGTRPNHNEGRLVDMIRYVKFSSISWTHDSEGFFYQRFPSESDGLDGSKGLSTSQDLNAKLYFHRVNTLQEEDTLVMNEPLNPTFQWSATVSESDGQFLELSIRRDTARKNMLWLCDLRSSPIGPNMKWIKLVDDFKAAFNPIHKDGNRYFILTNYNAPNYKLQCYDLNRLQEGPTDFLCHDPHALLEDVVVVNGNNFVAVYKRNVKDELHIFDSAGNLVDRPAADFVGSIALATSRSIHPWFFATCTSFTSPGDIWLYNFAEDSNLNSWTPWKQISVPGLDLKEFSTEQVWYSSRDGTRIPMFILKLNTTKANGSAPVILYGYGGFGVSVSPTFNSSTLTFLKRYRAVYAVANIRGGAEFGEDWHLAGTKERKVNCFDDFIAAAKYLVTSGIGHKEKICIHGASNGGLLVAACCNRAEQGTFGAAVAQVGVLDMLKFDEFTIGRAWTSDYGDPKNPHDFDYIYPISPLHNIPTSSKLPPMLMQTADHDDRVVPMHSFKHAATLQYTQSANENPMLISIDKKAGHGAGKTTLQRVREMVDRFAFIAQALSLEPNQKE